MYHNQKYHSIHPIQDRSKITVPGRNKIISSWFVEFFEFDVFEIETETNQFTEYRYFDLEYQIIDSVWP